MQTEDYHEQLDRLQRQIESDFHEKIALLDSQRAALEADHKTAIDTLAQLRGALSSNGQASQRSARPAKTLTQAVNHVIADFIVGDFDINKVIAFVIRHHPEIKQPINPTSVSGILRAHAAQEPPILELVTSGAGPRPAVYRLTAYGREQFKIVEDVRNIFG